MKKSVLLFFLILAGVCGAFAQNNNTNDTIMDISIGPPPIYNAQSARNQVGSVIVMRDKVLGYKLINDTLGVLHMGSQYPEIVNVILKGPDYNLDPGKVLGHKLAVKGEVILENGKRRIIVTQPDQILGYRRYQKKKEK